MKIFKHFFQQYNKPILLSDSSSGKIIEVNDQILSLFDKSKEEFKNLKRTDIFPQKAIKELNKQLKNNKDFVPVDTFIIDKGGFKVEVEITTELITEDENKYIIDTLCFKNNESASSKNSDISIDNLIKETETKYKVLFDSANDSIFLIKDTLIVELNAKALEMFGGTNEDLLGKTPAELSPEFQPDGKNSNELASEKLQKIENGIPQFFEWQHKKLDGTLFDAEVSLNSFKINNDTYILAIVRDITRRKQTENDLVESRKSLSSLLKNLPGIAYRCKNDKDWTMEYISEGSLALLGYDYAQIVESKNVNYGDIIYKEDREYVWAEIQAALEKKESFRIVYRIKSADGKIKWVWEQGSGTFDEETGEILYIEGLINEITEQKLTEDALRASEIKFRSLVEESLVGVYIIQDNKFSYVNPRFAEIFGYTADEIINSLKVEDLINGEEEANKVKENITKRLSGKIKTIRYTFEGKKKDNNIVDVEVMGTSTMFNNEPAIIGTLLDITEKKKSENEITKLSRGVEQSPASIVITDTEGNIEYVNPKFSEVTGYSFDEVIGKNPRILRYGDTPKSFYENLWETIKAGEEWRGEFLNKKKNGELYWEFSSISPVKDSNGKIINFVAVKEDITERKNVEEELRIAKEKAEEMNRVKSVFLANMSHELRTPMVAVLGYSEILKNEISNPDLKEMAKEVYESSHRFMNTLNLVLDLSRIESNKEVVNLIELDVISVVKEEFEFFNFLAKRKSLHFISSIKEESILTLLDERMLRQVISNITSNAIKFTNKGSISLEILRETDSLGNKYVIIKISDTGIGIPKNNQNLIFDAFRQVSEGLNKSFEGSGLGLTVSKKFIEMMHGTINVESEFGKGSTFIIKFPVRRKSDVQPVNLDPSQMNIEFPDGNKKKLHNLLIVEDDSSNAGVMKFFLDKLYEIDTVSSGEEALLKATSKKYSAVLMDIDLGTGMSGMEAAKKIKNIPQYKDIPIIAVTALAMRGDREKFLKEGCTHYLSKPFKREELIETIKEAITGK